MQHPRTPGGGITGAKTAITLGSKITASLPQAGRSSQSEICTAALQATSRGAAVGILSGYPGTPMVRTLRAGDSLTVEIHSDGRTIGRGSLALDPIAEPSRWSGEIEISGCRWWCSSERGSGTLTFQSPRRPFEASA